MKPLYKYLIVFSALIAGYLLFGAGAWLMPDRAVQRHVRETLDKGDMESDQPRAVLPHMMQTRMDNFTDAIILNQAYVMRLEGFRTGVLSVPRWWGPLLPYEVLRAGVDGQEMQIRHYARYWHGNTFLTRYLLVFYDYMDIRLLLYIVSTLLMVWCGVSLWRRVADGVGRDVRLGGVLRLCDAILHAVCAGADNSAGGHDSRLAWMQRHDDGLRGGVADLLL